MYGKHFSNEPAYTKDQLIDFMRTWAQWKQQPRTLAELLPVAKALGVANSEGKLCAILHGLKDRNIDDSMITLIDSGSITPLWSINRLYGVDSALVTQFITENAGIEKNIDANSAEIIEVCRLVKKWMGITGGLPASIDTLKHFAFNIAKWSRDRDVASTMAKFIGCRFGDYRLTVYDAYRLYMEDFKEDSYADEVQQDNVLKPDRAEARKADMEFINCLIDHALNDASVNRSVKCELQSIRTDYHRMNELLRDVNEVAYSGVIRFADQAIPF